jgi:hypothetical protein
VIRFAKLVITAAALAVVLPILAVAAALVDSADDPEDIT